ncbi:AraC family transcriptional regulator [Verrucomicrobiaceae bacterium N1E253]|uniref:AraC family transcriptional regulator n=1 Tax=Oceaniferula marina TaxID=2748318 RepID=A0A851GT85_9BACT|nr:AraC family transcriptional regulator [Oceaniferula marina]NWK57484.1 AraC family transcriptional regulator [Oceaniferula marina]
MSGDYRQTRSLDIPSIPRVYFVAKIVRTEALRFRSSSLSGHLIHFITEGEVEQEVGGVRQVLSVGQAVWYPANVLVRGQVTQGPWSFITVNFECPELPAVLPDQRVVDVVPAALDLADSLLHDWNTLSLDNIANQARIGARVLELIAQAYPSTKQSQAFTGDVSLWWQIERDYSRAVDAPLPKLCELSKRYHVTGKQLSQVCRQATGLPPGRRLRAIRMSHVRGLLVSSNLSVSEIAYQTGYRRVQDLSRDCDLVFGCSPTMLRNQFAQSRFVNL